MKLFSFKSELRSQVDNAVRHKRDLDRSVEHARTNMHDKIASPAALLSSFAAGAGIGWVATKPTNKTVEVDVVDVDGLDRLEQKSGVKKRSIATEFNDQLIGIGMSVIMAEVTRRLTNVVHAQSK